MTDEPDGPAAGALRALREAAEGAVPAVRQATAARESGELSAIEAVILLDDALTALGTLWAAVPPLVAAAIPGPAVAGWLEEQAADLAAATASVRDTRAALDQRRADESKLREQLATLAELRAQVDELRRLERLVTALTELQDQRAVIDERLNALRAATGELEHAVTEGSGELLRLSEDRRALLGREAASVLEKAAVAQQALAVEEERAARERAALEAAESRRARLVAEHGDRLSALAAHEQADRTVAEALAAVPDLADQLPVLDRVVSFADDIERRLREMDDALSGALAIRDTRYGADHPNLRWADPPSG